MTLSSTQSSARVVQAKYLLYRADRQGMSTYSSTQSSARVVPFSRGTQ